eukprot:scaffold363_cov331-Pavlova_lutheri.AAC.70
MCAREGAFQDVEVHSFVFCEHRVEAQSKVDEREFPVFSDHHVRGGEVSVYDPTVVQCGDGLSDVSERPLQVILFGSSLKDAFFDGDSTDTFEVEAFSLQVHVVQRGCQYVQFPRSGQCFGFAAGTLSCEFDVEVGVSVLFGEPVLDDGVFFQPHGPVHACFCSLADQFQRFVPFQRLWQHVSIVHVARTFRRSAATTADSHC